MRICAVRPNKLHLPRSPEVMSVPEFALFLQQIKRSAKVYCSPALGGYACGEVMSSGGSPHLSVVIPVFGCATCLTELCRRLFGVADDLAAQMEVVLVNDASPDNAWECMRKLAEHDPRVKAINLFRNFGQHAAISAGLTFAQGDWTVVMDCDLQDVPEELPKLYQKAIEGYGAVFARRIGRQDNALKRLNSWLFSRLLSLLSGEPIDGTVANYSIISREVVDGILQMPERHRSYGLLVYWLGPKTAFVDVAHGMREVGRSGYTFKQLLRLASDVMVSFSIRPLLFSVYLGFICSSLSVLAAALLVLRYFTFGIGVAGWASTVVSMWFLGGLILANMGVMGLYLGKIFEQVKGRPLYLVSEKLNCNEGRAEVKKPLEHAVSG
jgi:glycosyltransferase involved in cell wall biosynthesis